VGVCGGRRRPAGRDHVNGAALPSGRSPPRIAHPTRRGPDH
jgi:hypothetical protein